MKTALLILLLPLCGCVMGGSGMAKVVRELAKDPATIRLRFPTPYGVFELDRSMPGTNGIRAVPINIEQVGMAEAIAAGVARGLKAP